jgi:hypothetical protein
LIKKYMQSRSIPENFKIPENFIIVLNKMMPNIKNISPKEIVSVAMLDQHFLSQANIGIYIEVQFTNKGEVMNRERCSSEITNLFHATYPDYRFVTFNVESISVEPEPTNEEKFKMLFFEN